MADIFHIVGTDDTRDENRRSRVINGCAIVIESVWMTGARGRMSAIVQHA